MFIRRRAVNAKYHRSIVFFQYLTDTGFEKKMGPCACTETNRH